MTLIPNSLRFPSGCWGTAPFCPTDCMRGIEPTLEALTHYTWHLGFVMAPMKAIRAARKGGGSLFLDCTKKTAAMFSQWQKSCPRTEGGLSYSLQIFPSEEFQPFKTPPVQTSSSCARMNVTLEHRGGNQNYFYFWLSKPLAFNSQVFISLPKLPPAPVMLSMILFSGRGLS